MDLIGVPLSPPRPVRPLGKSKFNYQLNHFCRPEKILIPASVATSLDVTRVQIGEVLLDTAEWALEPVERNGNFIGYELVLPEVEAAPGQFITVYVENRTRKVALFYMMAVLVLLDEQKLIEAATGEVLSLVGESEQPVALLGAEGATEAAESTEASKAG